MQPQMQKMLQGGGCYLSVNAEGLHEFPQLRQNQGWVLVCISLPQKGTFLNKQRCPKMCLLEADGGYCSRYSPYLTIAKWLRLGCRQGHPSFWMEVQKPSPSKMPQVYVPGCELVLLKGPWFQHGPFLTSLRAPTRCKTWCSCITTS